MSVLSKISEILNAPESVMKLKDKNGELHELKAGKIEGEIIEVSKKEELNKLLFGKKRVGLTDIKEFREVMDNTVKFLYENAGASLKKKFKKELKDQFESN